MDQCSFDFDDMISIVCERIPKISPSPLANFKLVMIDEWQDTSESQVLQTVNDIYSIFYPLVAQLELVKLFAKCTKGISVVGGRLFFLFCKRPLSQSFCFQILISQSTLFAALASPTGSVLLTCCRRKWCSCRPTIAPPAS